MILVIKDYYQNDTIISITNFTTHESRLNYLPKQMLIVVIKSTLTRDRFAVIITTNFTSHGSGMNYLPNQMIIVVIKKLFGK
jgi:hypothetical protein